MARIALPQSKIRKQRQKRRLRIALIGGIVFVTFLVLLAGLSWLPVVRIQSIDVRDAGRYADDVETYVRTELMGRVALLFPKDSIFLYPKGDLVAGVAAAFPALHTVRIRGSAPSRFDAITVSVLEREPHALWCGVEREEEQCSFMDERGVVYGIAPEFSDAVYTRYMGATISLEEEGKYPKQYTTPEQFTSLSALVGEVRNAVGPIDTVRVDEHEDVTVRFVNGFDLLFSLEDTSVDVLERFMLARTADPFKNRPLSDFEYLDLRFGDKLYYKVKGE